MNTHIQRTIVITGCSSGIGLVAAKYLKRRGYRVIVTCRKESDYSKLTAQGFEVVLLDLDSKESVDKAAAQILEMTQHKLYALFNNAGYGVYGSLESVSRGQLEKQFSANFFGTHQLTMRLLPAMRANRDGRIIQTSSIMGFISTPGRGAYAASKYALEAWSDALRLELSATKIKVCLIEPGPIKTPFSENVNQADKHKKVKNPSIAKRFTLTPEAILPKLVHALESPVPKVRYRVTLVTHVTAVLKRLLPDKLMDKILASK